MEAAFQGAPDPPPPAALPTTQRPRNAPGPGEGACVPSGAPAEGGGGRRLGDHTGGRVNLSNKIVRNSRHGCAN